MLGCSRVRGDLGGGRFDVATQKGALALAAPNFATTVINEECHSLRSLAFPLAQWQGVLDEAADEAGLLLQSAKDISQDCALSLAPSSPCTHTLGC